MEERKNRFATVIRHVPHEGLGLIERSLVEASVDFKYFHPDEPGLHEISADCLIVMGGPMSVYDNLPWMAPEKELIRQHVSRGVPVLGICLGAQMIAAALGAEVKPCGAREIGWYPLEIVSIANSDPVFSWFSGRETVFQWHGDTFEIPAGAELLASSPLCPHQAFRYGRNTYALQFHLEVSPAMVTEWVSIPENGAEVAALHGEGGADAIESGSGLYGDRLQELARGVFDAFLRL